MTCPKCCGDTQVTYTYDNCDHVVRDRRCKDCGYKFQTIEVDEDFNNRSEDNSKIKELVATIKEIAAKLMSLGDKYD